MTGVLFSLLPLFFWGISDYISGRMAKSLHPAALNLFFGFGIGIPTVIICSFFGWPDISWSIMSGFFLSSTILTIGFMSQLLAFRHGLAGVVAPIANAYAIVTLCIAALFLDTATSLAQIISVLVVVVGIGMLSFQRNAKKTEGTFKSVIYALVAMVFFGIGFALFDVAATQEWYANAILFQISGVVVAFVVGLLWQRTSLIPETLEIAKLKLGYLGSIAAMCGTIGLFLALENVDNVAIPATIAAASPLVTVLLARHFDMERLTPRQYVAAVVVVAGIVLLGMNS